MPQKFLPAGLALLFALASASTTAADFVQVAGFEPADTLYPLPPPATIVFADGEVVDATHGRTIPIRARWSQEALDAGGALPVVVWIHGGNADVNGRNGSREWSETLARAGFVVVHPSIVPRTMSGAIDLWAEFGLDVAQGTACAFNPVVVDRPRDTSAVIDALPSLGAQFPALAGRLDLSRVVVAGHSFGAYTTRAVAGARLDLCPGGSGAPPGWPFRDAQFTDPRPIAFLALSPQGPGRLGFFEQSFVTLDRPEFMATGRGDITPEETPGDRLRSFQLIAPRGKYLLYIDDVAASHATFNLNEPLAPQFDPWLQSHVLAFLDAEVRGSATAAAALQSGAISGASAGVATLVWK
jgi:hypothetical protein